MADFLVAVSGVALAPWDDPASVSPDRPSRINPRPEHIHKRWVATTGVQVEVTATVDGVAGELDSNLGGELFSASFLEAPSLPFPTLSNPVGQSSVQRFTPVDAGHYTLQLDRLGHGGIILHVDVDP